MKLTKNRQKVVLVFTTLDTSQLKKNDDYENIRSVNPLYLLVDKVIGHIEEKSGNKYLVFDFTDKNKEVLKKYAEL